MKGLPIRQILVVLLGIPALALSFFIYQTGNFYVALALLIVTCLGVYIYLNPSANTFRYLFPGFLGFGLFVIFPIVFTIYIGFTKYSSQNLLTFDRASALFRQETLAVDTAASYKYTLYAQDNGQYVLYLEDEKDPTKRFASDPFNLDPTGKAKAEQEPAKLNALPAGEEVKGKPMQMAQINRAKLLNPLRASKFALPDETLVGLEGLTKFAARQRLWVQNPDGSLTNKKDGTVIRPDFNQGFFVNDKGEKVGVGFRTFAGFHNYTQILTDPRIRGPFFRIFLWTFAFSAISVALTFALGILLSVLLDQPDLKFRRTYRTLFILPYAVPGVLSILIMRGLFNQEFGAVNEMLRAFFGFAPEWETNPWGARAMVLLVNLWLGYPYMMLICTGMLQSIPSGIYEASAIDGSNKVTDFFQLTLPLVLPAMIPILISSFAFNFNNFNLIFLLTAGGPQMVGGNAGETDLLVTYTYNMAFRDSGTNFGLAGAIATLLFIIVGFLSWINLRLTAAKGEDVKRMTPEQKVVVRKVVSHALLLFLLSLVLVPYIMVVSASLRRGNFAPSGLLPDHFSLEHWKYVLGIPYEEVVNPATGETRIVKAETPPLLWFWNSVKISALASFGILLLSGTAAYAFARLHFKFRSTTLSSLLILQMFPMVLALPAIYVILDFLGQYIPRAWLEHPSRADLGLPRRNFGLHLDA